MAGLPPHLGALSASPDPLSSDQYDWSANFRLSLGMICLVAFDASPNISDITRKAVLVASNFSEDASISFYTA
jgi:hypothetical protein